MDIGIFHGTFKLKDGGIDVDSEKVQEDIKRYVKKTEGYTFDFVKELIQGIYVDDTDEDVVFERIENSIKHNGSYKISEEGSTIGFASSLSNDVVECDEICADDEPHFSPVKRIGF